MFEKEENKYLIFDPPHKMSARTLLFRILYFSGSIWYKLLLNIYHPRYCEKKYKISICAIFRDEGNYLKEWIEYHLLVGVEHFYLYNNFSEDNYKEILEPYIKAGLVTLKDWPYKQAQMEAYADCMALHSNETNWVGLIDLDEFVVPVNGNAIYDVLGKFKHRPVVIVQWRIFGTSGLDKRDISGLVTEDFISCWPKYSEVGKVFFNTAYDYCPESEQYMHTRWARHNGVKLPAVNIQDRPSFLSVNRITKQKLDLQINHYLLKSKDEYFSKKAKRGGGIHDVSMHDIGYFDYHEEKCSSIDEAVKKYLPTLKRKLNYSED